MKLIFLDFDGVLNSDNYFNSLEYKNSKKELGFALLSQIDPICIVRINELVNQSKAFVICSSAWRSVYTVSELNEILGARGATFLISDKTPLLSEGQTFRGNEIQAFLDTLIEVPEEFVILDDINDMLHLEPKLVLTNDVIGITDSDINKALVILKGK